jgi:hypothetical protein
MAFHLRCGSGVFCGDRWLFGGCRDLGVMMFGEAAHAVAGGYVAGDAARVHG